ncbi:hypothetical protein Tco_0451704 [Tanacetum coccineum]
MGLGTMRNLESDSHLSTLSSTKSLDVRGTGGAGLRRERKVDQVVTTCEEPSGQSLRRARNRQGMFTPCEETRSSRYDVRGTVGVGLGRARKLGQVATTYDEPSGQVYAVRGNLVKSLQHARNRQDRFTSSEEPWSSHYDVRGTVGASLRHARKLGQVARTCEERSGRVYVLVRRMRNHRGRFTSCEEPWLTRYDVRGTVGTGLRHARKLGQVATTCEEPSGKVYVMRGTLVGPSIRRAEEPGSIPISLLRILGWSITGLGTIRNLESDCQLSTLPGTKEEPTSKDQKATSPSKGSLGHAFTVRIRTGNQNQTSFYPSIPHEISVLVELILGHLHYLLTDVPPQPNSPPDNVFRLDRPAEASLGTKKRGHCPASDLQNNRYVVRGTVGEGLRRARKISQVATMYEELSRQVYAVRGKLIKWLRRARNRRGRFTSCEETWSSRYDVRGLRSATKFGQVATTCEKPSGQVYIVRGNLDKSLRRARNCRGRFTSYEETWSSRYDMRGTVEAGLRRVRKLGQVATTCEEPSGLVYVVRGTVRASLRRARKLGQVATTCEEPLGQDPWLVYNGPRNNEEPRIRLPTRHPAGHQGERVTMITLVHTSSELAVRRPGKAPERVVRSLSPSLGTMRNLGWSKTGLGMMRNLESDSQLSTLSSTKVSE